MNILEWMKKINTILCVVFGIIIVISFVIYIIKGMPPFDFTTIMPERGWHGN